MSGEFQGGVCGGNWPWNRSSTNLFRSSPCSSAIDGPGSFGWLNHEPAIIHDHMKTTRSISTDDSSGSPSDGSGSIVLQDHAQKIPSNIENLSIDSTLQMMGDWNQDLLHDNGRLIEENYSDHMVQANEGLINSSMNYGQNSSINSFGQESQSFPLSSSSYSYSSSLLQTLFDTDSQPGQQSLLLDNQSIANYSSSSLNYTNSSGFCPNLPSKGSSMVKPCLPKQQQVNHLQFTNNTPFWNAKSSNFVPSTQPQLVLPSSLSSAKLMNLQSFSAKHHNEEAGGLNSVASKKVSNEPPFKRPRIETPSPLPTFKVRKEKLGDRVTALQQLVSPFGKTDTASVLHEAIEYIKFLHDQVSVLSTPYLKYGSTPLQHLKADQNVKDQDGLIKDLKSRGLCLVPISSIFPVAADCTTDFWTPIFGESYK